MLRRSRPSWIEAARRVVSTEGGALTTVATTKTGALSVDGTALFPIGLWRGPAPGSRTPEGRDGLAEVASAGVSFVRSGPGGWSAEQIDAQIAAQKQLHAAAAAHGLHCFMGLGEIASLPPAGSTPSANEQLLRKIVGAFKSDAALLAYEGVDEPHNPFRPSPVPAARLVRAYKLLKSIDPGHPIVLIQAPRSPVSELTPYRPAFDVTGVDIYPVSYPPQVHSDLTTKDISVVGELARKTREAAGSKPFWMVLQVAWSGVMPTQERPDRVPRFPSLPDERFMAYQAIVNGARGLAFFGGHLTQVMRPRDAATGWNWTFWQRVLGPLVSELTSAELRPALVAADAPTQARASSSQIELLTRQTQTHVFLIAVRTAGAASRVSFSGLPPKHDGTPITRGEVLFEYVQQPLSPPVTGHQAARPVALTGGAFADWFAAHDARVYRFHL